MKIIENVRCLVAKFMDERANTYEPIDMTRETVGAKRYYTLRRAQRRTNTKGASAKKNVPGRHR